MGLKKERRKALKSMNIVSSIIISCYKIINNKCSKTILSSKKNKNI